MDWLQEAMSYPECNITRVRDFAPEADMKLAIGQYNRAVKNIHADSMDIAIIALRRLSTHHPAFAQAVLLYGCCQMAAGNLHAGAEAFDRADTDRFTERFRARAEEYREAAHAAIEQRTSDPDEPAIPEEEYNIRPTAPLVQRGASTRRRIRLRPNRISVEGRGGDEGSRPPRVREPLTMRYPFMTDWRRILLTVVALALVVFLVFGAVRLISGWIRPDKPKPASEAEKLAWLVTRLEEEAQTGSSGTVSWEDLLSEYRDRFGEDPIGPVPTAMPTSEPTGSPTTEGTTRPSATTAPSTARPTPTVTPIPSTAPDYTETLSLAATLLEDAENRIKNQPVESYRLLGVLSDTLAAVPLDAQVAGIDQSAGEMLAARDTLIELNGWHLCESHRVAAEIPWQARDYETCLPLYEAIYQINPRYYTGYCAFRLGLCYEQLGAFEQALACYRTVQEIGSASPQYASALARIAAIG